MRLISGCLQPTQLSWLPVLSSVVPPSLRREAATGNMLQIVEAYPNWPVTYADVSGHLDAQYGQTRHLSTQLRSGVRTGRRLLWSTTPLLPTLLSRPQDPCRASLHKRGLAQSPSCDCGQRQTMNHIVDTCPRTKFEGGLNRLHEADDDAVIWL